MDVREKLIDVNGNSVFMPGVRRRKEKKSWLH